MFWSHFKSKASVLLTNPHINRLRGVPLPHVTGNRAQKLIARRLIEGPCLIARVGETEGAAAKHFLEHRLCSTKPRPYEAGLQSRLKLLAGYFPISDKSIDDLARLYIAGIRDIDVYASWTPHDAVLCPPAARRLRLIDLDPFFTEDRWTLALAGRRVCVISPFVHTIQAQYVKRRELFVSPLLPDFHLSLVQAPMTQCETDVTGQSWQSNLDRLCQSMLDVQPDVVIIGAGAYGLPLGAMAKSHGIAAVVLGGSTQLLFGIKGARWENYRNYRGLFNDHWVRPSEDERPPGYQNFEIKGGAYW